MHVINANGAAIPALGFGTWTLRDVLCAELVAAALGIGYRHVDTAAIYGNEAEVGRGLRAARIRREDIFLTTKVWYTNIAPGDLERSVEGQPPAARCRLCRSCADPLAESRHSARSVDSRAERCPRCRAGASYRRLELLPEASPGGCGFFRCAAGLQPDRAPSLSRPVEGACRLPVGGHGHGLLLSAVSRRRPFVRARRQCRRRPATARSPGQVVLRWHVQQEGVAAIPRTTKKERLAENFAVFDFALSAGEMAAISALAGANLRLCEHTFPLDFNAE